MPYAEWCPVCKELIISVTRGIPSIASCANGHTTDRRDVLRRKPVTPDPHIEGWNAAIEAAASEAYQRLYPKNPQDDWTEYAKHNAAAAIEVGATIRAIPCPYQPKEGKDDDQ